uniref:SprT-like domain-containing protein n=1 Tax=Ditylenchus dipsaci TaxID=166011 RepID=A0A915CWJ7_9BILA
MTYSRDFAPKNLVDPSYELVDPTPDVYAQFVLFNDQFFYGSLCTCTVEWSNKLTSCAGICEFHTLSGLCTIRLSEPLLKLRPRKDLVQTLLHEMIHAHLCLTKRFQDRSAHGPEFQFHMNRINKMAGTSITIYHSFFAEVAYYKNMQNEQPKKQKRVRKAASPAKTQVKRPYFVRCDRVYSILWCRLQITNDTVVRVPKLPCLSLGGCGLGLGAAYCPYPYTPYACAFRYCGVKARAARTFQHADEVEKIEANDFQAEEPELRNKLMKMEKSDGTFPKTPDQIFLHCCHTWSLPSGCLSKCNFLNYTSDALRSMFFRGDECPIEAASIIHYCASQNKDHKKCCVDNGITTTTSGEKCLIFCDQMPKNETKLDVSYLPCLDKLSQMKKCFFEDALREVDYLEMELELEQERDFLSGDVPSFPKLGSANPINANEDEQSFVITRPPIVFVNNDQFQRRIQLLMTIMWDKCYCME